MANSNGNTVEQQIAEIHARIDGMDREFSRRTNIILDEVLVLTQQMESLTGRVDQLTTEVNRLTLRVNQLTENQEVTQANVNQLTAFMVQFAHSAEADRAIIRGIQTENQRILRHLFGE